ncbi:MAG: beta-ketoacyl-ACP synthase II [Firmicutes bacterium]|nr:beta-ketoacyl-ACP synthase II [Bacillota bacterium]
MRVVITGMGVISPLGLTVSDFWNSLKGGVVGIGRIEGFDTAGLEVSLAAEVKNFDPEFFLGRKEPRRTDRFSQFALSAALEAMKNAGGAPSGPRLGVIVSSGVGGLKIMEEQILVMDKKGPDRVSPLFIPEMISNMAAGLLAIKYGATGLCSCVVTACASSVNAIGEGYRNVSHGYMDACIVGGADACINRTGISGFAAMTTLSTSSDPARASIPFDLERGGFVMGEGSGILLIESLESALARNTEIFAEIAGYGVSCDAYHMTSPRPDGSGAAAAMAMAVAEAGAAPGEISYVNAHGTGTGPNDTAETKAIKAALGEEVARKTPISSTKSMTGHLLGAAGAIETIATVMALRDGFIPPTAGLKVPDPECDLDYVPIEGRKADLRYALNNSFGFGGHNAVLCLKRWDGR